jgi:hypothetical protein
MNEILITYSLIKSLYEKCKDYLDVFVPFVVNSFPNGEQECTIETLSNNLEIKFGLKVPEYTLNTIITRSSRSGYIKRKQKKCCLEEKGKKIVSEIKSKQEEIGRDFNALLEDIRTFISEKFGLSLDSKNIEEILNSFIKKQQSSLLTFFNPQLLNEEWKEKNINEFYLIEYFKIAKNQKPNEFKTLEKIFYGALISTIINKKDITTINRKFRKLQIFFDSNFMFSIMDLHYHYICKPAKELFEVLKTDNKFQLKVFDFTVDEMVKVLKRYSKEKNRYLHNVKVDSIYSSLRSKGWTSDDCIQFIVNMERKIYEELGVQIENTGIDLNEWDVEDKNIYSRLLQYKSYQNILGQRHDICSIYKIRELRGRRPQREIENCGALFLSSDLKLTRFDYEEFKHKDTFTVSEVISDRFLNTLLWLKNPKTVKELPLETILSIHSEILIDRTIWNRFYENLEKLKKDEKISDEDVATLIYYHQVEQDLGLVDNPDEITDDFVIKAIEKSKIKIDEETKKKIKEEKKKLEEEYKEKVTQNEEKYLKNIESIKGNIKEKATKKANVYSILIMFGIPAILLSAGIILLLTRIKTAGRILTITPIIYYLLNILGWFGLKIDVLNCQKKLRDYFFNKIHKKMLSELEIEKLK